MLKPSTRATWRPNVTMSVAYAAAENSVSMPETSSCLSLRHRQVAAASSMGAAASMNAAVEWTTPSPWGGSIKSGLIARDSDTVDSGSDGCVSSSMCVGASNRTPSSEARHNGSMIARADVLLHGT